MTYGNATVIEWLIDADAQASAWAVAREAFQVYVDREGRSHVTLGHWA